jgi:hypothetical protein
MLNCELWIVSCLLTSRHRRLPLKGRRSGERDLRYACLLPTAFERGGMERALWGHGGPGQDVEADKERKN